LDEGLFALALVNGFNAQKYIAREGCPLKSIAALPAPPRPSSMRGTSAPSCTHS
jgi:hypothetical protein